MGPNRWKSLGPRRPTGAAAGICRTTLSTVPVLGPEIHVFGLLKKYLASKRFATDADMKQAVTSDKRHLPQISSTPGYKPVGQILKCEIVNVDYLDVSCVPPDTRVPYLHRRVMCAT